MNWRELPLLGQGLLAEGDDWQVHLVRPGEPLFTAVLHGRQAVSGGPVTDDVDRHSTHYALTQGGTLQVWFRVTRAHQGSLDCEDAYPPDLIRAFRPVLASTSRLGRQPGPGRNHLVTLAMRCGWAHQLSQGAEVDLINARATLAPLYTRLQYPPLPGWSFTHPRTGALHDVRALAPACDIRGSWGDVFADVPVTRAAPHRARLAAAGRLVGAW